MKSQVKKLARIKAACHAMGALVLIGCGALAYVFAFQPLVEAKAEVMEQQIRCQEMLDHGPRIEREFSRLESELVQLTAALNDSTHRVPEAPEEAEFLHEIDQLASISELVIVDYRAGNVLTKSNHQEMTLALSTSGTYHSICLFLEQLNKLPRLCRVVEVKIATEQVENIYPCEMTLTIYYGLKD